MSNLKFNTSGINAVIGGTLLVTGTCIGAGMLGIPVKTSPFGLIPSYMALIGVWFVMSFTALVFLEVSLLFPGDTNFISMANKTLGNSGKKVAWITYLLFLYSLMAAYTSGGTTLLADIFRIKITSLNLLLLFLCGFVAPFAIVVYFGAKKVDFVNRVLIAGLAIAFFTIVFFGLRAYPHELNLYGKNNKYILAVVPLLVTSFGFHLLIPTLKYYLKNNVKHLRLAIIFGSLIPLFIYSLWVYIAFSRVPVTGDNSLTQMLLRGNNPGELLAKAIGDGLPAVSYGVEFFTFFALTSSFIGVSLGLFDFFADGLQVRRTKIGRLKLAFLTFIPPAVFTVSYPQGFMLALGYAGVFAAVLLIIYPALMAWFARYKKGLITTYTAPGGKLLLLLSIVFGVGVIMTEILSKIGYFATV